MKVKYFEDTDTLFIKLSEKSPVETRELNENVMLEIDENGKVVGLTVEQAKEQSGGMDFSYETIAAKSGNPRAGIIPPATIPRVRVRSGPRRPRPAIGAGSAVHAVRGPPGPSIRSTAGTRPPTARAAR